MGTIYRNGKVNTIIKNGKVYGFAESNGGEDVLSSPLITNNNVISGYYIDNTTGLPVADSGSFCNDFINVSDFDYLLIHYHTSWTGNYNMWYDENQDMLESLVVLDGSSASELYDIVDIPSNAKYFRLSWGSDSTFRPIVYGVNKQQSSILKGTTDPTSSQGSNGQIYLKYIDYNNLYDFKEYIEVGSTAGAYINTNIKIKTTHEFEIKLQMYDTQNNNTIHFGRWVSYKDTMLFYNNNQIMFKVGASNDYIANNDKQAHIYKATQSKLLVDNIDTEIVPNWSNVPTTENYYIFKEPNHDGVINSRVYYIKIWDNENLTNYLVPVERKSDNEAGMLDIITGIFYDNDGTQSFTVSGTSSVTFDYPITNSFVKVNGSWQNLIGSDIDDVGNATSSHTIYLNKLINNKIWSWWDTNDNPVCSYEATETNNGLYIHGGESLNGWTTYSAIGIDLTYYDIPTNATSLKLHLSSLDLTDYGGIAIISMATKKTGGIKEDTNFFSNSRMYIKTAENGTISETDYIITVDLTNITLSQYLYIGVATGMTESETTGYNNSRNGTESAVVDWIDIE